MSGILPPYNGSLCTSLPEYRAHVCPDERSLEGTGSGGLPLTRPLSHFVKKWGKATITLTEQAQGSTIPTYGRRAVIGGSISFESPNDVIEVIAIVGGKLQTNFSDVGCGAIEILHDRYAIWERSTTANSPFPDSVSFGLLLPSTFKHGEDAVPLPPSYNLHFPGAPTVSMNAAYRLEFVITTRSLLRRKQHIVVPIRYYPRRRAPQPVLPLPRPFSSIKTAPEDWYQSVTQLKTRADVQTCPNPLQCHFFVPASRIFAVTDTIPFHIQLSGNNSLLKEIFLGTLFGVGMCGCKGSLGSKSTNPNQPATDPFLQVRLMRRLTVTVKGSKCARSKVLATGTINSTPPDASECCLDMSTCLRGHVNWEGEIRLPQEEVGSFKAANVQVEDFITLTVSPPNDRRSPIFGLSISVPVQLVTDSADVQEVVA